MRIALIRQSYNPYGGAERFVERALAALGRADIDVSLLTRHWPDNLTQSRLNIISCNPFYMGRTWRDASFSRCVQKTLRHQKFSLVQAHEKVPGCTLYRAGDGLHRVWLMQRARALGNAERISQMLSPYHRYTLRAEEAVLRNPQLRKVICNSEQVKHEMQKYFDLPEEKLAVIYNGINLDQFSPALSAHRIATRRQLGIPQDAPLMLFVGSGFERKGVDRILRTLPKEAWLLVVGKDKHLPRYRNLADKLGHAQRVVFAGPQKDVLPYYGCADALILAAIYEPFGNVILEAMASGLPVIASNACGISNLIEPGQNGWVCDAFDTVQLHACQESMFNAIGDLQRHAAMRQSARKAVMHLSESAMAQRMVELYKELLELG